MEDKQIFERIDFLVAEEHGLRRRRTQGEIGSEDELVRLAELEQTLDQCWDLLRRRRAARASGEDPDAIGPLPGSGAEGYLQ